MSERGQRFHWGEAVPAQLGGSRPWGIGHLAFVLHRLTGIALAAFVLLHVLTFTKLPADPAAYDLALRRMQRWDFKLGESLLFAALLLHAAGGIRLLLLDFVLTTSRRHRLLFWLAVAGVLLLLAAGTVPLWRHWFVRPFFAEHLPGAVPG